MFRKYAELIKLIFDGITSDTSKTTFGDYIQVIGYTLGIMLTLFSILVMGYFIMMGPTVVYNKLTGKFIKIMNEVEEKISSNEVTKEDKEKYNKAENNLLRAKRGFWLGTVFIYVPLVIPTLLIVVDMILKILK